MLEYADFLNEFTERRRLSVFFSNGQTAEYGAQVGHVNVGKGNLSFVRKDLVTVGRVPLVLARVYDSRLPPNSDFGQGWCLTAAETIHLDLEGNLTYRDDSASSRLFVPDAEGTWVPAFGVANGERIHRTTGGLFQVVLPNKIIKEFAFLDKSYRLTTVQDHNGNRLNLSYENGRLTAIDNSNRKIVILRGKTGRIETVRDDSGREANYRYNARGLLKDSDDLGGHRWRYHYNKRNLLTHIIEPDGYHVLAAGYDEQGRANEVLAGKAYSYSYRDNQTTVLDGNHPASYRTQPPSSQHSQAVPVTGLEPCQLLLPANR